MSNTICFNTGCDLLDLVVGGGIFPAYPAGRIINIIGDKSSGKTFLACELIAAARHKYGNKLKWIYDDCESGFTHDTKSIYGFEIMPEKMKDRTKSKTVQDLFCNYSIFLDSIEKDECGIYVVDSLDGLKSKEEKERMQKRIAKFKSEKKGIKSKEKEKGSYQMEKPKYLSQEFFPGTADLTESKKCLLVVLSQIRDKVDAMFVKVQIRNGGKAMDFYCFCCLWVANIFKIKKQDRVIGILIKAHAKKSKTPRPYRECMFPIYFTYGIDNIGANLDFLYDLRGENFKLLKSANNILWGSGKEITVKALKDFLKENQCEETYKEWSKDKDISTKEEKIASMVEFINSLSDTKEKFNQEFGQTFTRDELIKYIEDNNLQSELTEKVKEKWESIENSIKLDRPRKYQ